MKSLREIVLVTVISAAALLSSCKTKEPYLDSALMPVPVGAYMTETGEQTELGKRQAMLEKIIEEYDLPYVADIIYYDELNHERYYQAMRVAYRISRGSADEAWDQVAENKDKHSAVTLIRESWMGKGAPSVILVPGAVFEKHQDKQDLISFIVDHEGMHAKDNATGLMLNGEKVTAEQLGKGLYIDILELRAYNNQQLQIEQGRDVSDECKDLIAKAYKRHHQRILRRAINGNKHAQAAMVFAKYTPFTDLDHGIVRLIKKQGFFKNHAEHK